MMEMNERHPGPELMDIPGIPGPHLHLNYRELDVINRRLGGYAVTWKGINRLNEHGRIRSLLDVGSGGGDMLDYLDKKFKKLDQVVDLTGADLSEAALTYSITTKPRQSNICFIRQDVFQLLAGSVSYDVITAGLFMHHFSTVQIISLLNLMWQRSRIGIVINDLHRHLAAYYGISLLTGLFSRSYLVKHDAPLSVRRGFRQHEWKEILRTAGIPSYSCSWEWAFRHLVVIHKEVV